MRLSRSVDGCVFDAKHNDHNLAPTKGSSVNDNTVAVNVDDIYDMAHGFVPRLAEDMAGNSKHLDSAIGHLAPATLGKAHASWTALAQNLQAVMGTSASKLRTFAQTLHDTAVDIAAQDGRNADSLGSPTKELDDATEQPLPKSEWTKALLPSEDHPLPPPNRPGSHAPLHTPEVTER